MPEPSKTAPILGQPRVDILLCTAGASWSGLRSAAREADGLNIDTVWVTDHLSGEPFGRAAVQECFTVLAGVAAITERIHLGPLVANCLIRSPFLLNAALSTLQEMSQGRVIVGLGVGGSATNRFSADKLKAGITIPPRAQRYVLLEEQIHTLDELWSLEPSSSTNAFPRPNPRPKLIVGGYSTELARIAGAKADGFNINLASNGIQQARHAAVEAHERAGRRTAFEFSVWTSEPEEIVEPTSIQHSRLVELWPDRVVVQVTEPFEVLPAVSRLADYLRAHAHQKAISDCSKPSWGRLDEPAPMSAYSDG